MPDKEKQARKILAKMNKILLIAQMTAGLVGGPPDPDRTKRLKADLKKVERLKLKLLNLYGFKGLYQMIKELDDEIAFAAEGARIMQGKIGPDFRKAMKEMLLEKLKEIRAMTAKLEKTLKKAGGKGPAIDQCKLMDHYLDRLIQGGRINDIPERLVSFLHDLKRYIVEALPYTIGHGAFAIWYRELREMDRVLQGAIGHLEQAGDPAQPWALSDAMWNIARAKEIKNSLEPLLGD